MSNIVSNISKINTDNIEIGDEIAFKNIMTGTEHWGIVYKVFKSEGGKQFWCQFGEDVDWVDNHKGFVYDFHVTSRRINICAECDGRAKEGDYLCESCRKMD